MLRLNRLAAVLAVLGLIPGVLAQDSSVVDRIIKEGRENSRVMSHLDHLVNKIGPRLTGSDRLTQAQEWARDQFKSFGLQNCRLEQWGTYPVGFNRGPWKGTMIAPEKVELTCATMAWTPGTKGPVLGTAVLAPESAGEAETMGPKLHGAWVLITGKTPKAVLTKCDELGAAGYVRSVGGELIITDGNPNVKWERLPKRVTVYLTKKHHQLIRDHVSAGKEVKLEFDIRNEFKQGPVPLYNVIAEIPGAKKPEEIVIVGGHIDSWDGATGTTDNGTGTCTTLEAARLLSVAKARPDRTIRFMLWSGEEQGLLGSAAWIKAHKDELPRISACLVHDGGTNYVSGISATEPMVALFEKIFEPVMTLNTELKFKVRKVRNLPFPIGSDHDSFTMNGVPGFFWDQARTKAKGQNYEHEHHTQHDLYPAAVPDFQQHSSMVIAIGALGIANLETLVPREGIRAGRGGGDPEQEEEPRPRRLGINCGDDLILSQVFDGTPAAAAGLQEGDQILKLGDTKPGDLSELRAAIQASKLETTVTLIREGKEMVLKVTFPE